jgi:pimeloyl-ACP methyl ester carboxylesterase
LANKAEAIEISNQATSRFLACTFIYSLVGVFACTFICGASYTLACRPVEAAKLERQAEPEPTCRTLAYGPKPLELDLYSASLTSIEAAPNLTNTDNSNPVNANTASSNTVSSNTVSSNTVSSNTVSPDLIICAHGGAWKSGDKADRLYGAKLAKSLIGARQDYASINYRLAPRFKYPAQIEDCNRAINFLVKLERYKKSKIVLFGHSAGAQIVAAWVLSPQAKPRLAEARIKEIVLIDPPALEISKLTDELKEAFGENAGTAKLSLLSKLQNLTWQERAKLPALTMILSSDWRGKREQQSRAFFTLWHRNTNRKDTLIKVPENHTAVITALQAKKYQILTTGY